GSERAIGYLAASNGVGAEIGRREAAPGQGVVAHVGAIDLVVDDVVAEDGVRAVQRDGGAAAERHEQGDRGRDVGEGQVGTKPRTHWTLLGGRAKRRPNTSASRLWLVGESGYRRRHEPLTGRRT